MSRADVLAGPVPPAAPAAPAALPGAVARLLRSELRLVFGRRRNVALLSGLAAVPLLLGIVLYVAQGTALSGQGPGFVARVTGNGLFLVVAALFMCLPFLLPLTIGIASGDAIAGEASSGTLRYLLTLPVRRGRLLAVKAVATLVFVTAAVLAIALVALATGAVLFGVSDLTLLSGTTIPAGAGLARVAGVTAYVAASLTGLVAVGLFFSTLTEVPVGAMAATVVVAIVSAVLDTLPQLAVIHPGLLTHHWLDFAEMLRLEVDWGVLGQGLAVQAAWVAVFGALAWGRFATADVTS
ncbi:ABC transporter permease [Actinotalea subterranea]|uniref:ABC transporter permease n=1 Tax=Actinotalea subterranea TaxID=2607497 RepID=UPI0011EF158C|nr:ABC transporter permease [Actinotalea subterranea]